MGTGFYNDTAPPSNPPDTRSEALTELRAIRAEMAALRKLFDHFAGVFLNTRFPYGDGRGDRWPRR